jgi:hypothetical protein
MNFRPRTTHEWKSWHQAWAQLRWTWNVKLQPRIFTIVVAVLVAILAGAEIFLIGYGIGKSSGPSEDRVAKVRETQFRSAFQDARANAAAEAARLGRLDGAQAGRRAAARAGAEAGARRGSAAVAREQAAIAAAAADAAPTADVAAAEPEPAPAPAPAPQPAPVPVPPPPPEPCFDPQGFPC